MAGALRVLVSGASGLIGTELTRTLREQGDEVLKLVRHEPRAADEVNWAPSAGTLDAGILDDVDAVVNLSGASVGRIPWTTGYKQTLRDSRIVPTRALAEAIGRAARPPAVFVSASAVGFYGDRPGERLTEDSAAGVGFFPDLVRDWEAAAALAPKKTRVVNIRSGVVVAHSGGFGPVRLLSGFGLGTRFGAGSQFWPWISLHDEIAAIRHVLRSTLSGPVNLVGPEPATSDRVTASYARQLHRPYLLRAPAPVVRALGEAGQRLLLDSMRVSPVRLTDDGFSWRDGTVDEAIARVVAGES